jgi:site-specific DNA-methyltransferase (adenine-specific)
MKLNQIIEGDCLKQLKKLKDETIDVVITSPPFNLNSKYNSYNDNQPVIKYYKFLKNVFIQINRVLKKDGSFFLDVGSYSHNPFFSLEVAKLCSPQFVLQNHFIWVKSISIGNNSFGHFKPINSEKYVNNNFEDIFHFTKLGDVALNRLSIGVPYVDQSNIKRWSKKNALRCQGNCWFIPYDTINSKKEKGKHPAIFPVKLAENCIKIHGIKKDMIVLDPFAGTGSALVAAQELGVDYIGIEIDKEYVKFAQKRLEQL